MVSLWSEKLLYQSRVSPRIGSQRHGNLFIVLSHSLRGKIHLFDKQQLRVAVIVGHCGHRSDVDASPANETDSPGEPPSSTAVKITGHGAMSVAAADNYLSTPSKTTRQRGPMAADGHRARPARPGPAPYLIALPRVTSGSFITTTRATHDVGDRSSVACHHEMTELP